MGEGPIGRAWEQEGDPSRSAWAPPYRRASSSERREASAGRDRRPGRNAPMTSASRRGWCRYDASAEGLGSEAAPHLIGKAAPEHVAKGPGKAREGIPRSGQRPPAPPQPTSPRHPTFVVYFAVGR